MSHWFEVKHLDVERLLEQWRWLCSGRMTLIARSAFGDLFLADEIGEVSWLDVSIGKLQAIAGSVVEFRNLLEDPQNREQWFGEADERGFLLKGLVPNESQCIGFDIPLVFNDGGVRKPYIIDIYENVSFLGDLNKQIADSPDGGKIKLIIGPPPLATDH